MGILDKFKTWLQENEDEFKQGSEKAAKFIEDLGRELHYAGQNVSENAEKAFEKIQEEFERRRPKQQAKSSTNPYDIEPDIPADAFMDESEPRTKDLPSDEDLQEDVSILDRINNAIDDLLSELKKEEEDTKKEADQRSHMQAIQDDWGGLDDSFMKKAADFADRKMKPGSPPPEKEGKVKGFEDLDGDGDEIIDDATVEE